MLRLSNTFFFVSMVVVIGSVVLSNSAYSISEYATYVIFSLFILLLFIYLIRFNRVGALLIENATFTILFYAMLGLVSCEVGKSSDERHKDHHFEKLIVKNQSERLVLKVEKAQSGKFFNRYECEVLGIVKDSVVKKTCGSVLLFIKNRSERILHKPGNLVCISAVLKSIEKPKNSTSINWKKHYELKGIYHEAFIKKTNCFKFLEREQHPIYTAVESIRSSLKQRLRLNVHKGEIFALLTAMILGDKTNLNATMRDRFSKSGVMHVLAVSGLHVGIIYLMLSKLSYALSFLLKRQVNSAFFILIGIWGYAIITGCSPSVVRASFMFTLITMAQSSNGRVNMINILSCSACILTLLDPLIIYQIGFQLSHVAVAGIVLLYPFFNSIISFRNKVLSYIWSLMSVSIAAQLSTFPLAVCYFNIFPNYFLLSNFIAVPISGIIITLGIALIAFSDFGLMASILSNILSIIVDFLLKSTEIIAQLPGSVSVFQVDRIEVVLLYVSLTLLVVLIYFPSKRQLYALMISILATLLFIQTRELFDQNMDLSKIETNVLKVFSSSLI